MFSRLLPNPKSRPGLSQFLQMRWNRLIFRFLPFSLSRLYITVLGRIYYLWQQREQALIRETIQRVFQGKFAPGELQDLISATFRGIFAHYHEKLFVGYSNFPRLLDMFKSRVRFQGLERLQETLDTGKGVILVTAHFGAVELLPGALVVNGFLTSMICRFQTTCLREAQGRRAGQVGLDLIDTDKGKSIFAAMKALKQGRILITECDEFEAWRPGQRDTQFLDHRLKGDRTLEVLHRRSGAPVIAALVTRDGRHRYTCHLTAVDPTQANLPISQQCLQVLEAGVYSHPEQWYKWQNFGKMIETHLGVEHDHQKSGYLAPAINLSLPHQA